MSAAVTRAGSPFMRTHTARPPPPPPPPGDCDILPACMRPLVTQRCKLAAEGVAAACWVLSPGIQSAPA